MEARGARHCLCGPSSLVACSNRERRCPCLAAPQRRDTACICRRSGKARWLSFFRLAVLVIALVVVSLPMLDVGLRIRATFAPSPCFLHSAPAQQTAAQMPRPPSVVRACLASPRLALPCLGCLALPGLGWAGPGLKRPFPCCCSTRHLSCAHVPCGGTQQSSPTPTKGIARKLTSGTQAEPESKLPKLRNEAPEQSEESKRTLRA